MSVPDSGRPRDEDEKDPSGFAASVRGGPGGGEARSAEQPPGADVPIVNPANAITAIRLLVTPVFVWACIEDRMWVAVGAYIGSSFIDLFDGMVARRLRCETNFGANFDAAVDALFYTTAFITLAALGMLSTFWTVVLLAGAGANMGVRAWYAATEGRWVNYRSYASEYIAGAASGAVLAAVTGFHGNFFLVLAAVPNLLIPPFDFIQIRRARRAAAAAGPAPDGVSGGVGIR